MITVDLIGIFFALTSAAVWGSGDFSGGLASRRCHPFQVLVMSSLSGMVILVVFAVLWRETLPPAASVFWAALAGLSGAVGVAALYRALSVGNAAAVAPLAAVVSAALPVVFGLFTEGLPGGLRLAGFGLALAGIWLVSRASAGGAAGRWGLGLALLAGAGFAGFFILIAQVGPGPVFTPLIVARAVSLGVALLLLAARRLPLPGPGANPVALLAGLLDAGGNVFYMLAQQYTRLDVAVVLASLYPAATVLLARLVLDERVSAGQWLGAGVCLAAIVLIAV